MVEVPSGDSTCKEREKGHIARLELLMEMYRPEKMCPVRAGGSSMWSSSLLSYSAAIQAHVCQGLRSYTCMPKYDEPRLR